MKFNVKNYLQEATGSEGYMGFESDSEVAPQPYQGIADPRHSMGAFGTVNQNQAGFRAMKSLDKQQIDQLQASVFAYLAGEFLDYRQPLYNVKVRLNHMGLDFDFSNKIELTPGRVSFKLSRFGQKFGTTPTNNLMQGFDTGTDYTDSVLSFDLTQSPSGKYSFRNVNISQPGTQGMQAESFYATIAQDEHLYENIFKPVILNLLEKEELSESVIQQQLEFIVERSAKYLNVSLTEADVDNLSKGLYKIVTEQSEPRGTAENRVGSGAERGEMANINALAKASGKDPGKMRRDRRRLMLARLKGASEKKS